MEHAIVLEQKRRSGLDHDTRGFQGNEQRAEAVERFGGFGRQRLDRRMAADTRVKPSSSRHRMGQGAESFALSGNEKLAGQAWR